MIELDPNNFEGLLSDPLTLRFTYTWLEEDEAWPIREQLYAQMLGWTE